MLGGVQKTTDFLDKSTWTLATILIALILLSSLSFSGSMSDTDSKIIEKTETAAPQTAPIPDGRRGEPAAASVQRGRADLRRYEGYQLGGVLSAAGRQPAAGPFPGEAGLHPHPLGQGRVRHSRRRRSYHHRR